MAGKRGHGEGTIFKRRDGRWCAELYLGIAKDGKRQTWRTYGDTRREVADALSKVIDERRRGQSIVIEKQTLAEFLNHWLTNSVKPSVRPLTYESYEVNVRVHILPELGRHELTKLAPQHVQHWLNERVGAGLAPRTVQYAHAVLRRALNQALKWGLVHRNVATLVDVPRVVRPEVQPFTPEQARLFLSAAAGDRLRALYTVAITTGLRQGELLGLRWEDLDFETATLRVRVALQRVDGGWRLVEPKTPKSRRVIGLPAIALAALREHCDLQDAERRHAGERWEERRLVFTTGTGRPLDGPNVTHQFQHLLVRAGLPRLRFHDLRHTCASLLLADGIPPRVIMETLGHSQISLTMNTYAHVMPALQREAAKRMDELLGR